MGRRSGLAVGIVLAVLLGAVVLGPIADQKGLPATGNETTRKASGLAAAQQFNSDSTEYELTVYRNGSTRWTIRQKRALLNETQRQNFEDYARRFNNDETDIYKQFVGNAQRLARLGSGATGRRMEARGFRREAVVGPLGNQGIVEMSFMWTNFAVVHGDRVVLGDVFEGGDLSGAIYVGENQQFTVQAGDGLAIRSAEPTPDVSMNDSATWNGQREFNDGRPHVVLGSPSAVGDSLPAAAIGAVLVLLGVAAAVAWRFGGIPGSGSNADGTPKAEGKSSSRGGSAASSGFQYSRSGERSGREAGIEPSEATPAVSDEELLADDDRVIRLLRANGGRMRQVSIVEETDWSKSKVSMLLSDMAEDGQVSKLRIGRENIVSLEGHEPGADGSSPENG